MSESSNEEHPIQQDETVLIQDTSKATIEPSQEIEVAEDQGQLLADSDNSSIMGQYLACERLQNAFTNDSSTQLECRVPNSSNRRHAAAEEEQVDGANEGVRMLVPKTQDVATLEEQSAAQSLEDISEVSQVTKQVTVRSLEEGEHVVEEGDQSTENSTVQPLQRRVNENSQSDEIADVLRETIEQGVDQLVVEGSNPTREPNHDDSDDRSMREGNIQEPNFVADTNKSYHSISGHTLNNDEGNFPHPLVQNDSRTGRDEPENIHTQEVQNERSGGVQNVQDSNHNSNRVSGPEENLSRQVQEFQERNGLLLRETSVPVNFANYSTDGCRQSIRLAGRALHKFLENPLKLFPYHLSAVRMGRGIEIDALYPNTIDGPELRFCTHFTITDLKDLILLARSSLHILRLPRLISRNDKNFDYLFAAIASTVKRFSNLSELVFEDNGAISAKLANHLCHSDELKKVEVHMPKSPVLRALTTRKHPLKEVCFHALMPDLRKELTVFLQQQGRELEFLSLGFSLSVHDEPATSVQRLFWKEIISILDDTVPTLLSQLRNLELSSSPLYKVKHRFSVKTLGSICSETERALQSIQSFMKEKCKSRHPKETEISLTQIKLTGGEELVTEALTGISWVNQSIIGVHIQIPGVHAVFQRCHGGFTPVVLQSAQLDQFIFNTMSSRWLEVTALKEIDLGEVLFMKVYNTSDSSLREATRRLVVTSRESLSKICAHCQMPN